MKRKEDASDGEALRYGDNLKMFGRSPGTQQALDERELLINNITITIITVTPQLYSNNKKMLFLQPTFMTSKKQLQRSKCI